MFSGVLGRHGAPCAALFAQKVHKYGHPLEVTIGILESTYCSMGNKSYAGNASSSRFNSKGLCGFSTISPRSFFQIRLDICEISFPPRSSTIARSPSRVSTYSAVVAFSTCIPSVDPPAPPIINGMLGNFIFNEFTKSNTCENSMDIKLMPIKSGANEEIRSKISLGSTRISITPTA